MSQLNLVKAGFIIKTHGFEGHLKVAIEESLVGSLDELKFLFLEIESMHIPFYVTSMDIRDGFVLIKLEGVNTKEDAQKYNGTKLFIDRKYVGDEKETELLHLSGYIVMHNKEQVGVIKDTQQFPHQLMAILQRGEQEILIPLHDGFVVDIDHDTKTLELDLPQGLLDLNN